MSQTRPLQLERARRLLALEGASGGDSNETAAAAGRVYDKLDARLTSLLGAAGVHALFARSAKLAQRELASLAEADILESSQKLYVHLQGLAPEVATRAAEALFGSFLALITTFIGERLTLQALRSVWPAIDEPAPRENKR